MNTSKEFLEQAAELLEMSFNHPPNDYDRKTVLTLESIAAALIGILAELSSMPNAAVIVKSDGEKG